MQHAPSSRPSAAVRRLCTVALAAAVVGAALALPVQAQEDDIKIGVVRMNEALNESVAGQRSKKVLLASKQQMEDELRSKEEQLKQLNQQIQSNMMLTEEARGQKQQELRQRQQELREAVRQAQQELQQKERQLTESIFTELQTVVDVIAREREFDFILEQGAAQAVLFSRYDFIDITDAVIERYNRMEQDGGEPADSAGSEAATDSGTDAGSQ